jgi:Pyruvate/2-oxoacid:ferredoxin oxidoreductase gamma subunit
MASWRFGFMAERQQGVAVVHIRFDGRSLDIPQGDLDVGLASDDQEIKRALARHLEVSESKLRDYVVDRHKTGNLTVRPEAVFG